MPARGVALAPPASGSPGPSVPVDSSGRALVDDDPWTVLDSAEQIGRVFESTGQTPVGRGQVLSALQLAGYWPTADALKTYLRETR